MSELISREWISSHPKNVLGLEHPETYTCVVQRYEAGHPTLVIRVHRGDHDSQREFLEVTFSQAEFFCGPMEWIGANLCLAPQEEWTALMQQLRWLEGVPAVGIQGLADSLRLFIMEGQGPFYRIQILAANILTELKWPGNERR